MATALCDCIIPSMRATRAGPGCLCTVTACSAIVIWDSGPGRLQPPPFGNVPPVDSATNHDPHQDPRNTPAARTQKSDFLLPNGAVLDMCAGQPCHTAAYVR